MTREALIEIVINVANARDGLFSPRRAGMHPDIAARIIDVVVDEVLELAKPSLEADYSGSHVLQQLYALRGGRRPR